jgi:hypothetical protein
MTGYRANTSYAQREKRRRWIEGHHRTTTLGDAAKRFGVTKATIEKDEIVLGVKCLRQDIVRVVLKHRREMWTHRKIAELLNVSSKVVKDICVAHLPQEKRIRDTLSSRNGGTILNGLPFDPQPYLCGKDWPALPEMEEHDIQAL